MVAAGPDVAVNIVLGLPFIKATGMVADFVDNVCEAKNLLCEPFPFDFKHATKSIPVFQSSLDRTACIESEAISILHVIGLLRSHYDQSRDQQSPEGTENSCKCVAEPSPGTLIKAVRFNDRWVPPGLPASDHSDYQHQVLGHLGYLSVPVLRP